MNISTLLEIHFLEPSVSDDTAFARSVINTALLSKKRVLYKKDPTVSADTAFARSVIKNNSQGELFFTTLARSAVRFELYFPMSEKMYKHFCTFLSEERKKALLTTHGLTTSTHWEIHF